MITSNLYEAH